MRHEWGQDQGIRGHSASCWSAGSSAYRSCGIWILGGGCKTTGSEGAGSKGIFNRLGFPSSKEDRASARKGLPCGRAPAKAPLVADVSCAKGGGAAAQSLGPAFQTGGIPFGNRHRPGLGQNRLQRQDMRLRRIARSRAREGHEFRHRLAASQSPKQHQRKDKGRTHHSCRIQARPGTASPRRERRPPARLFASTSGVGVADQREFFDCPIDAAAVGANFALDRCHGPRLS